VDSVDDALNYFRSTEHYKRSEQSWKTSIRQKGVVQPQFFTEEARKNWMKNPAQNTPQWKKARSKYMKGRKNPDQSKRVKGEGNPNSNKGYTYIELTTGFKGNASEMAEKFGIARANVGSYAKADRPMRSGIAKGRHFQIYQGVKRVTKRSKMLYKELSSNTEGYLDDLCRKFNIPMSQIIIYSKTNRPIKKGKYKGLHFTKI
jgi:hypothetical protein